MDSLHTISLKESTDDPNQTIIYVDSVYLRYTLTKSIQTFQLINDLEDGYQNVLYNEDPDTDQSCSFCGRTNSKKEIRGTPEKYIGNEEPVYRTIHLCKSCSELLQKKLTSELKEYRPEDLLLTKI